MAGARVIPLMYNDTDEHLVDLVSQINGVMYPEGGTNLIYKNGSLTEYSRKGKVVLDKIKQMNDNKIHFPVLGICLGMQEITVIEAPYPDVLQKKKFDSDDIASNVTFSPELISSKLYKSISPALIVAIQHENITYNHHQSGVFPETFKKYPSLKEYLMLGVSYDLKGLEYTASIENKKYPFFGFQYHPEKNGFIWGSKLHVPHSKNAVDLMQYYSNYFVGEAKKNNNHFRNESVESKHLIQNYPIEFTNSAFDDIYIFNH